MQHVSRPVTVIGAGYVGLVTAVGLSGLGHDVHLVERAPSRLQMLLSGRIPIHEDGLQAAFDAGVAAGRLSVEDTLPDDLGIVLVCVGTPIGDDGQSDLRQLDGALRDIAAALRPDDVVVIRSTLPVGGTRQAVAGAGLPSERVLTNPEFLRQGTAVHDFAHPSRVVVGRFPETTQAAIEAVLDLYAPLDGQRIIVEVEAAEIIKNAANAFLALKLSFTNELAGLCEEAGADVDEVLAGIGADPRIGRSYMHPSFGFGGSCLPKELTTLALAGRDLGLPMHVTAAASAANGAAQDRFAIRVADALDGVSGRTIGLLGLAFKAGTDDIRDSPAVRLAARLLADGAVVRAYDPAAGPNAAAAVPGLVVVDDPADAVGGADAVVIATEWPEFRDLPWAAWAGTSAQGTARLVIDGRRLLDPDAVRSAGWRILQLGDGRVQPPSATAGPSDAAPLAPGVPAAVSARSER